MEDVTKLRLQLLANGYSPIRNRDKTTYLKDWPNIEITEEVILDWGRRNKRDRATGLRVENGLVAIDIDIDDQDAVDALADAATEIVPLLADETVPWLERSSGKAKVAWFFRVDEPFGRLHTRRWVKPGQTAEDGTHVLEVFGGASSRQMGAFGPHTVGADGEVLRSYVWRDASPADTPLDQLLVLTKAQCAAIVDAAEALLEARGWTPVARTAKGENSTDRIYDLEEHMLFDVHEGPRNVPMLELKAMAEASEDGLRTSASWLEGPDPRRSPDRCLVSITRAGFLAVWDSATGVTHIEAAGKPIDYGPEIDRIAEKLKELDERRRRKIKTADDFHTAVAKMIEVYAYCPYQQMDVVPLWASSPEDGKTVSKFRLEMLPNCIEEIGPRGGRKKVNPVDGWLNHERRVVVQGIRMRPDMPRPTFEESSKTYVNCYDPPLHLNGDRGDVELGLEFFEHLLPHKDEREWFLDWLAFKIRYPHIPGPAVVMVAHQTFGTGRGTLGVLIGKLFGEGYVRNINFAAFTGRTYQSQYNEWQADALMVLVNESSEVQDGSTYQTKRNTYEHLKEIIEVRPTVREIMVKGRANYRALSSTSFLIFTNHSDALPIPEHDRRICVVRNGGTKTLNWWSDINEWIEHKANVTALYDWLRQRDISQYSPFATPPVFPGKRAMIEEAKSDFDRAFELAMQDLSGVAFTLGQIDAAVRKAFSDYDLEQPNAPLGQLVRRHVRRYLSRVGERNAHNWYVTIDGQREAIYARTPDDAAKLTKAHSGTLTELVKKGGMPEAPNVIPLRLPKGLKR